MDDNKSNERSLIAENRSKGNFEKKIKIKPFRA
jgi:hypothetical protein